MVQREIKDNAHETFRDGEGGGGGGGGGGGVNRGHYDLPEGENGEF